MKYDCEGFKGVRSNVTSAAADAGGARASNDSAVSAPVRHTSRSIGCCRCSVLSILWLLREPLPVRWLRWCVVTTVRRFNGWLARVISCRDTRSPIMCGARSLVKTWERCRRGGETAHSRRPIVNRDGEGPHPGRSPTDGRSHASESAWAVALAYGRARLVAVSYGAPVAASIGVVGPTRPSSRVAQTVLFIAGPL
jgi:hypothetical protein